LPALARRTTFSKSTDVLDDHVGALLCSDASFSRGEIPGASRYNRKFPKYSSTNMVDHEAVRIVSAITDQAANARRTAADNNCSPLVVRLGPLMSPILVKVSRAIRSQR
jgi:hypothetical protein